MPLDVKGASTRSNVRKLEHIRHEMNALYIKRNNGFLSTAFHEMQVPRQQAEWLTEKRLSISDNIRMATSRELARIKCLCMRVSLRQNAAKTLSSNIDSRKSTTVL
jgi:hypothetical protein